MMKGLMMKPIPCEKIILGESLGVKLIFCQDCNVVELEIGAVSVRICPDVIQQVANVMMKASLHLDQVIAINKAVTQQTMQLSPQQMIH